MKIRIATRGSKLALWQAHHVAQLLASKHPDIHTEIITIKTTGDTILNTPLYELGGKGLFLKEIEEALLNSEADIAVHSLKDVPYDLPDGLEIGAILNREDPRDALILRDGSSSFATLTPGSRVGTSSLRRRIQMQQVRGDLDYQSLRGNVDTRLQKLKNGDFDAIVLAAAGLHRLGLKSSISQYLDLIPSVGQGAIGIEHKTDRDDLKNILKSLHCDQTAQCVNAERVFLKVIQGSCNTPVGCHVVFDGTQYQIRAMLAAVDGSDFQKIEQSCTENNLASTSQLIANKLMAKQFS